MKDSGKGADSRKGRKKHPKRRGKESAPQPGAGAQAGSAAQSRPQSQGGGKQAQGGAGQGRPQGGGSRSNRAIQGGGRSQSRERQSEASKNKNRKAVNFALMGEGKFVRKRSSPEPRPKWAPPQPPALSLPPVACIWCEKPIREFSSALTDPETGKPVHFDCAVSRIAERERLEEGDAVGYIGGGRFGIISFDSPQNAKKFKIKKILEWESSEIRSEWRVALCEHFSIT